MMDSKGALGANEEQGKTILLIEADMEQARLMEAELNRDGFDLVIAASHLKALSIMEDQRNLNIVLVQVEATDIGGFDFVHLLRHRNRFISHCLQVIMIGSGEDFEKFPEAGNTIDDYLLRPYFPGELSWRVRKAWNTIRAQEHIASASHMDSVSGMHTATGLERALHQELNKSFRERGCFSLAVFECDGLESIHLNYGLMMADWLERDLTMLVRSGLRSYDLLGKMARGRYALIAPDVDNDQLPLLLKRIDQRIREWNASVARNSQIQIPLQMLVMPLTVFPDFAIDDLSAAVDLLWNWILNSKSSAHPPDAVFPSVTLTRQIIAQGDISALAANAANAGKPSATRSQLSPGAATP